jgi:hypothetical protein
MDAALDAALADEEGEEVREQRDDERLAEMRDQGRPETAPPCSGVPCLPA